MGETGRSGSTDIHVASFQTACQGEIVEADLIVCSIGTIYESFIQWQQKSSVWKIGDDKL